jgi:hypothetical protein
MPEAPKEWLLDVWHVTQVIDDAADGDKITGADASSMAWAVFARMPLNDFYRQYQSILQPVLVLQLLKWEAANAIEANGQADERSYVWRAGFYDLVLMVCHLCGIKAGEYVLQMYGETFLEYMEGL